MAHSTLGVMDTPELPQNDTQTTLPSTPVTPPPPATGTKRKHRILFLLAVPIAIFVLLAVWQMYAQDNTPEYQRPVPIVLTTPVPTEVPTPMPTWPPETRSYPSPTDEYTLTITEVLGSNSCTVEIFDAQGELIPMQFNFETLPCESYFSITLSPLEGWVNPTSVLFESEKGVLTVYKIGGEQMNITYDTSRYRFREVNYDLSQWLYFDNVYATEPANLYIMDAEQSQLRSPLAFGPNIRPLVLYDAVNNGYFVEYSQYMDLGERGSELPPTFYAIQFTFQWIDGETLTVHDLGTQTWEGEISPAAEWCDDSISNRMVSAKGVDSIPGTIIFNYDCFALPDTHPFANELRFEVPR